MTRREYLWISDLAGEQTITLASLFDLVLDERLDQSETLEFDLSADDPRAAFLVADGEVRWRDRRFMIRKVGVARHGAEVTVHVECDALWYRLGESVRAGSVNLAGVTVAAGLAEILNGSGWTVSAATSTGSTLYSMELQDATVLALVRKWATITSTVVTFDTSSRTVRLTADRGRDLGVGFRYGRNVTRIRREVEVPYATRLLPYGAQELNIAGVNGGDPHLEDLSWYTDQGLTEEEARARFLKTRVWSDPTFVVDVDLKAAAELKLAAWAQPTIRYECDVVDLSEITGAVELLEVGDTVRVADEPLGLDVRTTVVRYTRRPLQPWRNQFELAYLPSTISDGSDTSRPQSSIEWLMFKSDNLAEYQMRNDGSYLTNRIGLNFREGGEAVFGFDINGVGVGAGTLTVTLFDAETDEDLQSPIVIAYTDGAAFHENATWAMKDLQGQYDVRVRMVADSSGAASPTNGIDLPEGESRLWVLAHGAVQQTPAAANSETFEHTGAIQQFTVPDNVTEVTIEAAGGGSSGGGTNQGGRVTATFPVIPGQILDVYVGGAATQTDAEPTQRGWPDGGAWGGWTLPAGYQSEGGGGSSQVRAEGAAKVAAWIVAAGAGGAGEDSTAGSPDQRLGGSGGFYEGERGWGGYSAPFTQNYGTGATQFAGGPDDGAGVQEAGTFEVGGDANFGDGFNPSGGGGGGGWYCGGGGAVGGGGGGSGWINPSANYYDLSIEDGVNPGDGYVTISWADPLDAV
jgi:phage minor structural protein